MTDIQEMLIIKKIIILILIIINIALIINSGAEKGRATFYPIPLILLIIFGIVLILKGFIPKENLNLDSVIEQVN